jgi:hypothetical protein
MSWTLDIEIVSAILVEYNLVRHGTSFIGSSISSSFCAYVERPNPISYVSCTYLNPRWSWTPSWTRSQTLEFRIGLRGAHLLASLVPS